MIEVKNLTKKYGKKTAVKDFSFSFEKGKVYGLVGNNGAGKSTIINMITGYIAPTDGSVIIDKKDIEKFPAVKFSIGYLPESSPLYGNMSVREYLDFVAEIKGVAKDKRESETGRVMKYTSVADFEKKLIKNLSDGVKKRVGIAQALIGNPEILIFDEPISGLDTKEINDIKGIIKKLKDKYAMIISSHTMAEVSALCDEIIVISHGKYIIGDTPENLKKMLGDTEEIEISIVGKVEKAANLIRKIKEVKKVESIGKDSDGHNKLRIEYVPERDIRENITTTLVQNKLVVIEMIKKEASLEEAFLKLTADVDSEE